MSSVGGSLFRRSTIPQPTEANPNPNSAKIALPSGGKSKKECFVFEPQQWRKTVCKNCFRSEPEHKQSSQNNESATGPTVILRRTDDVPLNIPPTTTAPTTLAMINPPGQSGTTAVSHLETKADRDRNGTGTVGNGSRSSARKLGSAQCKTAEESRTTHGSYLESRRSSTGVPTNLTSSQSSTGVRSSASSIDARYIEELENDFFALEDRHDAVLRERDQLNADLEAKSRSYNELQNTLEQYREKVNQLERRCHHMEEDIKSYRERLRMPESDQSPPTLHDRSLAQVEAKCDNSQVTGNEVVCSTELQQRLNDVEQLCQEVMEENEQLKEEVEEMQREIEEMHDHFQEDDRDAMRDLQRDLESANKSCRILQFKLRKAERRFEQCEAERANLEERLARLETELYSEADVAHIRTLEEEIRVAKEVGVRLNNELDLLDEKRVFYEDDNRQLKEELQTCHNRRIAAENELGRAKLEVEKLRAEKGILDQGPLQVTDKNRPRHSKPSLSREASLEEQQLQRDLEISRERETDLSEQLRFAEEEIRKLKRRIKESQTENDMLSKRYERLYPLPVRDPFQFGHISGKPGGDTATSPTNLVEGDQVSKEFNLMRHHLAMVEEENLTLRRKLLGYERERCNQDSHLRSLSRQQRSADGQDIEALQNQLNLIQDHLARLEEERDRLHSENHRLRTNDDDLFKSTTSSIETEADGLKQKLKEWNRGLRQVIREVNLICSVEKDQMWVEKYNEACENVKELEDKLLRTRKRMADLQDENTTLKSYQTKCEQQARRERQKCATYSHMSRELLASEIKRLEEELDEVTTDLTASREQASTVHLRIGYLEDVGAEYRTEAEQHQKDLTSHIFYLSDKNQILISILNILYERTDQLQIDVDRFLGINLSEDGMETSGVSHLSTGTTATMGSDDVFDDQTEHAKHAADKERQLNGRILSLERLLKEEKRRSLIAEEQIKKTKMYEHRDANDLLMSKQLELLKKELEEKDELLESKDEQVTDLRTRIDQARKMNDALRALMEREPTNSQMEARPTETNVEIASYRKEIESARKELQILRTNLSQAEKVRERLMKENKELQEELKLREDSIFDQDDEIEKRNAELRALKTTLESLQKELDQTRQELSATKAREASGSSNRLSAQIVQNERIRAELHEATRELNDLKIKYDESKRSVNSSEEKLAQLSNDTQQLRTALQQKDAIIIDLNKTLQQRTDEVGQYKLAGQTTDSEKSIMEKELAELKTYLTAKEKECSQLQVKLLEAIHDAQLINSRYSQDSGLASSGVPDSVSGSGTLSRRSAEVDRLRRELSMMRRERDEFISELKHVRSKLEKKQALEEQRRKEAGMLNLPSGNTYAKAIAAQQTTTKLTLLNEHIASLNRVNVELKLQNEGLHNKVLDYQRRYRSLKEQYEGEQESWLTERVVLESKAKEQEDRKFTIMNNRKLLQETAAKLYDLEVSTDRKFQEMKAQNEVLEKERNELQIKLSQIEEHQKLPKVLQRFGTATSSSRSAAVLGNQSRLNDAETKELTRRLESAERSASKLRGEVQELKTNKQMEQCTALQEAEHARQLAEQEAEDLKDRLLTMECYRQQAELFRHRQFEAEEHSEKAAKLWQEERAHLIYQIEESLTNFDHWCVQLQYRADCEDQTSEDVVNDVVRDMEKWRANKNKLFSLKKRMMDSSFDAGSPFVGSVPVSPAPGYSRSNLSTSSTFGLRSHGVAQRSTSMEWAGSGRSVLLAGNLGYSGGGHGSYSRESSVGSTAGLTGQFATHPSGQLRGSALSLAAGMGTGSGSHYSLLMAAAARCGRSVSPDVTVRKISNYPDPTPGYLIRATSREGSHDSLSSSIGGDYTQRSFTLPGKPPIRSAMSPARRRFFEEAPKPPLPTTRVGMESERRASLTASVDLAPDVAQKPGEPEQATPFKKGSSQPPLDDKSANEKSRKSSTGSSLSLADRFIKWSSMGSKSSSRTSLHEAQGSSKDEGKDKSKSSKTPDTAQDTSKTKKRFKSPVSKKASSQQPESSIEKKSSQEQVTTFSSTPIQRDNRRSGSVSNISPAIMALRQKFAGGTK